MRYLVPLLATLVFPFMLPFMGLVVLVAVLGKTKNKPAENFGDICDD